MKELVTYKCVHCDMNINFIGYEPSLIIPICSSCKRKNRIANVIKDCEHKKEIDLLKREINSQRIIQNQERLYQEMLHRSFERIPRTHPIVEQNRVKKWYTPFTDVFSY